VISGLHKPSPRLVLLTAVMGSSAINYGFGLAMGWLLSPGDYGLVAFVQTLLLLGGMVLNSALAWSLARAVVKVERPHERDALVRGALVVNSAIAVSMSTLLVVLFAMGPLRGGFEQWPVTLVVTLCLPLISLIHIATGCAQGTERFGIVASLTVTEMTCKTLSGVALVLLGFGALGAIAGFLVGAACATALAFYQLVRGIGVRLRGSIKLPDVRTSVAIFGALLGLSMLMNLHLAGFKLLADERALVGYYQAGLMLSNAPYFLVVSAMAPVLFVQLARYNNVAATQEKLGETLALTAALLLPFEIILMVVPTQALVTFFPDVYAAGAPGLRILALGNALLMLTVIFAVAFQAVGQAKVPALILLAVILVEPFAIWAVVPSGQALGAAWVFVAAAFLTLFGLVVAYLRESRAVRLLRRVAHWVIRYALAVGVGLAAGRLALGLGTDPAVAVGMLCYLVVATLVRIIRPRAMLPGGDALFEKPLSTERSN
jgi:O-antigen/teichoic acid export membrane protein